MNLVKIKGKARITYVMTMLRKELSAGAHSIGIRLKTEVTVNRQRSVSIWNLHSKPNL